MKINENFINKIEFSFFYDIIKLGDNMEIKTGYIYHIKDKYFDKVNDRGLMINHESGHTRPTYFTIKDREILWFIPLSSKVEKYETIVDNKNKKIGSCKTIMIRKIAGKKSVILLQNAFPILEKYIDHPHIINGKPLKVIDSLKEEILDNFKYMMSMKKSGRNLFFTDIDKIRDIMLDELNNN